MKRVRSNHSTCDVVISASSSPSLALPAHSFALRRSPVLSRLIDKQNKSSKSASEKVVLKAEWTPNERSWTLVLAFLYSDALLEGPELLPLLNDFIFFLDASLHSRTDLEAAKGLAKALELPNLFVFLSRQLGLSAGKLSSTHALKSFISNKFFVLDAKFATDVTITAQGDEKARCAYCYLLS